MGAITAVYQQRLPQACVGMQLPRYEGRYRTGIPHHQFLRRERLVWISCPTIAAHSLRPELNIRYEAY
jgi:hypothetical protein